jgi:hypothetical protein
MYVRRILNWTLVSRELCSVLSSYGMSRAVGLVFIKLALRCTFAIKPAILQGWKILLLCYALSWTPFRNPTYSTYHLVENSALWDTVTPTGTHTPDCSKLQNETCFKRRYKMFLIWEDDCYCTELWDLVRAKFILGPVIRPKPNTHSR